MSFNARELAQDGGMYYGINQITNNLIIFHKDSLNNPNGFILGVPGQR
ncbi:hypothetical protein FACS189499_07470 [Clostridia bacterium]|nr:hypothetical protein FACS189499_07470 [Clostridia bacterium]